MVGVHPVHRSYQGTLPSEGFVFHIKRSSSFLATVALTPPEGAFFFLLLIIFVDPSPYTINLLIAYDENTSSFCVPFFHPPNRTQHSPSGPTWGQLYPIISKYGPILPNYAQLHPITPSHTTSTTQAFLRGAYQWVTCFACSHGGSSL